MTKKAPKITTTIPIGTLAQSSPIPMHSQLLIRKNDIVFHRTRSSSPTCSLKVLVVAEAAALAALDFLELQVVGVEAGLVCWFSVWCVEALAIAVVFDCVDGASAFGCLEDYVLVTASAC